MSGSDRADAFWIVDQEVPCRCAGLDDCLVAVPDQGAELVVSQIFPDVLHRVQFRRVGRQGQQRDVVGHAQSAAGLVPAGAVAEQDGMGARRDLGADLFQMLTHCFGVDGRHDDRGADGAVRADGAEQVGGVMAVVAHHQRARADRRPDIGVCSLLPDPGFVLEPDLDRRAGGAAEQRILQQAGEVFLKASSASATFFGWQGRGCSRVRPSWRSHLPIVLSCTSTVNRRRDFGLQIHASPAHNLVARRIGTLDRPGL